MVSKQLYIYNQHKRAKRELTQFMDTPGWHGIVYGVTGSGKTTVLMWILDHMWARRETIVWRDNRKANEFAVTGQFAPLKIFVPRGCGIIIDNASSTYECVEVDNYDDIFNNLVIDRINVISVEPYLLEPVDWLKFWNTFFKELVRRAERHELLVPMALFFDEFNQLAPSKHLPVVGTGQAKMTAWIAHNIQRLRSLKVRVIGASHGVTALEKSIRDSFTTHFYKRTMGYLDIDVQALKKAQPTIQNLKLNETLCLTVGKYYTKVMKVPNYQVGELSEQLRVHYIGEVPKDWVCDSIFLEGKDEEKERNEERVRALVKYIYEHNNVSQKELGKEVGVSQQTISNWINKED